MPYNYDNLTYIENWKISMNSNKNDLARNQKQKRGIGEKTLKINQPTEKSIDFLSWAQKYMWVKYPYSAIVKNLLEFSWKCSRNFIFYCKPILWPQSSFKINFPLHIIVNSINLEIEEAYIFITKECRFLLIRKNELIIWYASFSYNFSQVYFEPLKMC